MKYKDTKSYLLTLLLITSVLLLTAIFIDASGIAANSPVTLPKIDLANLKIREAVKDDTRLSRILSQIGVKKTIQLLLAESGGGTSFDCHQEAHKIGRIAYKVFREKAFAQSDFSCHSGAYHGAMEGFLNEKGTQNLAVNIENICHRLDTSFGVFECLHGAGHGIMAYLDYDLPEAIKICQQLGSNWNQQSCFGGVFMENILTGIGLGASTDGHKTAWLSDNPLFPCNQFEDNSILYECYQMQTSWMLKLFDQDIDKIVNECQKAPASLILVCFKSLGRDIAGLTLRDPQKITAMCAKVPDTESYRSQCTVGAVNVIIDFWGPDLKDQATQLCKMESGQDKQICYLTIATRLKEIFKNSEQIRGICQGFESEFQNYCNSPS